MRIFLPLLLLAFAIPAFASFPQERTIQQAIQSSVVVDCYDINGELVCSGSGTRLSTGDFLTAKHVIADPSITTIKLNQVEAFLIKKGKTDSFIDDWALLKSDCNVSGSIPILELTEGEYCFRVGNDSGDGLVAVLGIIGPEIKKLEGGREVAFSVRPGASGGGLFNGNGRLIGIVTAMNVLPSPGGGVSLDSSLAYFIPLRAEMIDRE